ncbi:MAG: TIGR00153 family protein [Candidatus Helarchaeota archaeon]
MGTLLEWFKNRGEADIIRQVHEHVKKVYKVVSELDKTIKLLCEGKSDKIPKLIKNINELENDADEIRRKIMIDLTKKELIPNVREDLAHLTKYLDSVANNANALARRLGLLTPEMLSPIYDEVINMSKITLKCVDVLKDMVIKQLGGSTDDVIESVSKIQRYEHDVDYLSLETKKKLIKLDLKFSSFASITIQEILNVLENITDSAEETAEFIKIINVRS